MIRRKNISTLVATIALAAMAYVGVGCTNDIGGLDSTGNRGGESANCIVLNFSGVANELVVQTRAENLNDLEENRVRNIYIYIFDASGDKVYSRYFDSKNQKSSQSEVDNASDDCWYVNNSADVSAQRTTGTIKIHTTSDPADTYRIYGVANLDADMVDISSDRLSQIATEEELLNTKGTMVQNTISRNGYLQMTGALKNVHIATDGTVSVDNNGDGTYETATLKLFHLDAKVHITLTQGPKVESLENAEIRVVNVPRSAYVFSYDTRGYGDSPLTSGYDSGTTSADFFSRDYEGFDKLNQITDGGTGRIISTYEGWFYMLENRRSPKQVIPLTNDAVPNYAPFFERSRQTKEQVESSWLNKSDSEGNRDFMYADNYSTYAIIKCTIKMELEGEQEGQELGGDLEYILHLGDFGNSSTPTADQVNNFNVNRNTYYNYTVTVNGVHSVTTEVDARGESVVDGRQPGETQPAAFGSVVVAKEEIAVCDAHYTSRTLTFHAKNITADKPLTWLVSTPFGEGGPEIDIEGNDIIPPGLDYLWVKFRVNKMDGNIYSANRRDYTNVPVSDDPDGVMNVSELVRYIKEQHNLYLTGLDKDTGISSLGAFDKDPTGPKICVTAFVDEFYYDYDPRDPNADIPADFWKLYVNAPKDRYMYILSDSFVSSDKESRSTGSVITIQQKPIQSIYDTNPDNTSFHTAWGVEHVDEYDAHWSYSSTTYSNPTNANRGNTDQYNGRLNTIKEWELFTSNTQFKEGVLWDTYVDFEVDNDQPELNDGYKMLRYSCMTRNRDNNGNGIIDQDEVRWYMASIRQLVGMTIGSDLLTFNSRLYNRTQAEMEGSGWRQHVVSSTASGTNASNNPIVLWGEEVASTSTLKESNDWSDNSGGSVQLTTWTVRCVRNLGTTNETKQTGYDLLEAPADYIDANEGDHSITCTRINEKALRYQTTQELVFGDEKSEMNRLSKKFYVHSGTRNTLPTITELGYDNYFLGHNNYITDVGDSVTTGHCPEGYRLPNQREMSIIFNYFNDLADNQIFCRTYYSFGSNGSIPHETGKIGWAVRKGSGNSDAIQMNNNNSAVSAPRCVRDASIEELEEAGLL
ncbi:MAG: DUF4906 domain-containing protein [Tidjanibacter sp.]|nr:DUF4906 domain-containing protein [Tidjanibacter sp.]